MEKLHTRTPQFLLPLSMAVLEVNCKPRLAPPLPDPKIVLRKVVHESGGGCTPVVPAQRKRQEETQCDEVNLSYSELKASLSSRQPNLPQKGWTGSF